MRGLSSNPPHRAPWVYRRRDPGDGQPSDLRLPPGCKGTRWDPTLQTLCIYRFIDPGSEWRLHRYWFDRSAVPELLASDFRLAESHRLYECHDLLLKHKGALFTHLTERWKDFFNAKFEVLLYDLTKLVAF